MSRGVDVAARREPSTALLRELLEEVRQLRAEAAADREANAVLRTMIRRLLAERAGTDPADERLIVALGVTFGDDPFAAADALARPGEVLAAARRAADIVDAEGLGYALRRLVDQEIAGLRLERCGRNNAGARWIVRVVRL